MNLYQVALLFLNVLLVAIECKQRMTRVLSEDEIACDNFEKNNPAVESKQLTKDFIVRCLNTMFNQNSNESTGDKRSLDITSLFSDLEKLVASKNISVSPLMAMNATGIKNPSLSIMNDGVPSSSYLDSSELLSSTNLHSPDQNMKVKIAQMKGMAPLTIEGLASHQIPPGNLKVSFPLQILQNFARLIDKKKNGKQPGAAHLTTASTGGKLNECFKN